MQRHRSLSVVGFALSFACLYVQRDEPPPNCADTSTAGCGGGTTICGDAQVLGFSGEGPGLPRISVGSTVVLEVTSEHEPQRIVAARVEPTSVFSLEVEEEAMVLRAHRAGTAVLSAEVADGRRDRVTLESVRPTDGRITGQEGLGCILGGCGALFVGDEVTVGAQMRQDRDPVLGVNPSLWELTSGGTVRLSRLRDSARIRAVEPGHTFLRLGGFDQVPMESVREGDASIVLARGDWEEDRVAEGTPLILEVGTTVKVGLFLESPGGAFMGTVYRSEDVHLEPPDIIDLHSELTSWSVEALAEGEATWTVEARGSLREIQVQVVFLLTPPGHTQGI